MSEKKPIDDGWDDKAASKPARSISSQTVTEGVLSKDEVEAVRAQAREEILKQKKVNAKKRLLEEEKSRLQREEGLTTGSSHKDQMVNITIDVAEYTDRITLNGKTYFQGRTYAVQRHVAESIRDIMFHTHEHQNEVDGKSAAHFYRNQRSTSLSPVKGIKDAPRPFDA